MALASIGVIGTTLIRNQGEALPGYVVLTQLVLPGILVAWIAYVIRIKPALAGNTLLFIAAASISTWGTQGAISFLDLRFDAREKASYDKLREAQAAAARAGRDTEVWWPHERLAEYLETGTQAYPVALPRNLLRQENGRLISRVFGDAQVSISGVADVLTVHCNESGKMIVYTSDSYGYRNENAVWQAPDLMLVGDSFVQGNCVEDHETFAGNFGAAGIRALNLGMAGTGPLFQLAALQEYIHVARPKAVVWFYFADNDLADLRAELSSEILTRYLSPGFSQSIASNKQAIDMKLKQFLEQAYQDRVAQESGNGLRRFRDFVLLRDIRRLLEQAEQRLFATNEVAGRADIPKNQQTGTADSALQRLDEVFSVVRSVTRAAGIPWFFVELPGYGAYCGRLANADGYCDARVNREYVVEARDAVLKMAEKYADGIVDVTDIFDVPDQAEQLFWFPGSHYTPLGYRLIADRVHSELSRNSVTGQ